MYIFKEVTHFSLKKYSYWTKGFYVQLRDFFFLCHLSIAINCHLVTKPDLPDVRLTFFNGRDWNGPKKQPIDGTSLTIFISSETDTSFLKCWSEMLHWDTEWGGKSFPLQPVSSCWGLPVIKDRRRWFGWGQWFEDSDLRDYLMIATCLVSLTPEFWFAVVCSSLLLPQL